MYLQPTPPHYEDLNWTENHTLSMSYHVHPNYTLHCWPVSLQFSLYPEATGGCCCILSSKVIPQIRNGEITRLHVGQSTGMTSLLLSSTWLHRAADEVATVSGQVTQRSGTSLGFFILYRIVIHFFILSKMKATLDLPPPNRCSCNQDK